MPDARAKAVRPARTRLRINAFRGTRAAARTKHPLPDPHGIPAKRSPPKGTAESSKNTD